MDHMASPPSTPNSQPVAAPLAQKMVVRVRMPWSLRFRAHGGERWGDVLQVSVDAVICCCRPTENDNQECKRVRVWDGSSGDGEGRRAVCRWGCTAVGESLMGECRMAITKGMTRLGSDDVLLSEDTYTLRLLRTMHPLLNESLPL